MTSSSADVVDRLVAIEPGSPLDVSRRRNPDTRANIQASYLALFEPSETDAMTLAERFAAAVYVCALHDQEREVEFYRQGLAGVDPDGVQVPIILAEAARGRSRGPTGSYPNGPLSHESVPTQAYVVSPDAAAVLGKRLTPAFNHAHLSIFHPRDARRENLEALLAAGWTATGIITLSQLVSFLAFQLRVTHGLRVLSRRAGNR